jgi:nucleotide-binding universal stress UspA family protein
MYKTVLLPLDGSPFAEHAISWASQIAQLANANLEAVRVHEFATPVFIGSEIVVDDSVDETIRQSEKNYLQSIVDRLHQQTSLKVRARLLEGDGISKALEQHAIEQNADLVVLTSHGRGAFGRFWLGSVADKFVRHTTIPTFVIRPTEEKPDPNFVPRIRSILVPLDGSEDAEDVLDEVVDFAKLFKAEVHLLLVLNYYQPTESLPAGDSGITMTVEQAAQEYLKGKANWLTEQGLKVEYRIIYNRSVAPAILDEAKNLGIDIIALTTHGRGGLKRLFLGSVADKVLRGSTVPVLLTRPSFVVETEPIDEEANRLAAIPATLP